MYRAQSTERPRKKGSIESCQLLELPAELIAHVASVHNLARPDLLNLALTCRRLSLIVLRELYKNVTIEKARVVSFVRAVENPSRAIMVKSFRCWSDRIHVRTLTSTIAKLTKLEKLSIRSSLWNNMGYGYEQEDYSTFRRRLLGPDPLSDIFIANGISIPPPQRVLPNLRALEISYSAVGYLVTALANPECFLSATLNSLTIEGAILEEDTASEIVESRLHLTTPLEYLHLPRCRLCFTALSRLLRLPQALKILKGSQGDMMKDIYDGGCTVPRAKEEWVGALEVQKHSLEEVMIGWLSWEGDDRGQFEREDFVAFKKLKLLEVNGKLLVHDLKV